MTGENSQSKISWCDYRLWRCLGVCVCVSSGEEIPPCVQECRVSGTAVRVESSGHGVPTIRRTSALDSRLLGAGAGAEGRRLTECAPRERSVWREFISPLFRGVTQSGNGAHRRSRMKTGASECFDGAESRCRALEGGRLA